jgi:hypothetical protein
MIKLAYKILLFGLYFIVLFIFLNAIFLGVIVLTDWDFKKRIESLKFVNPDYELLVLGDSFAEYGVDTKLITDNGIKSYNLAIVGNTVRTSFIQLKEYFLKYQKKPKYVILAVNSFLDQFDDGIRIQPIVEFTMKNHRYSLKDAPVSKFRWLGIEFIKKIVSSKHRKARLSHGQIKWSKTTTDYSQCTEKYLDISKYEQSGWIGEIAKLCYLNEVNFIIVDIPSIKNFQNRTEVGPYRITFSNGYSADLYNFNSQDFCSIFKDDRDWIGQSHFNECGSAKFTGEMMRIVLKLPY